MRLVPSLLFVIRTQLTTNCLSFATDTKTFDHCRYCYNCIIGRELAAYWPVDNAIHVGKILTLYPNRQGNVYVEFPDNYSVWIQTYLPTQLFLPGLNEGECHTEPHQSPQVPPDPSTTKRKCNHQNRWTPKEDETLLDLIDIEKQRQGAIFQWSSIAKNMPSRSSKQCRETYTKRLNPKIKRGDWNPLEDATIFQLHKSNMGWAAMSLLLPGRTGDSLSDRFDSLVKRGKREDELIQKIIRPEIFYETIHVKRLRPFPKHLQSKFFSLWEDMTKTIAYWASISVIDEGSPNFGPFREANTIGEQCARCGLFAPSIQCGDKMCTKTSWCITCTKIPPQFCGNWLRECLNLRRCSNMPVKESIGPEQY